MSIGNLLAATQETLGNLLHLRWLHLVRSHSIEVDGRLVDEVQVAQPANAGDAEVTLLASGGGLPEGTELTVSGATFKTGQAARVVDGNLLVVLDSPLETGLAAGDAVSLSRAAIHRCGQVGLGSNRRALSEDRGALTVAGRSTIMLETETPPLVGDRVETEAGEFVGVVQELVDPKGPLTWRCEITGGAS